MGLDMYLILKKEIRCPHCNFVIAIQGNNDYEIFDGSAEIAYWRKKRELFDFISEKIIEGGYGEEQYGQDKEITVDGLEKIVKFINEHNINDRLYSISKGGIERIIPLLKEHPEYHAFYSADW
jgi:hypothetical protein